MVLLVSSCSKQPTTPIIDGQTPQTELTYAPVQFDTTSFRVHLFWNGFDDDGEVIRFHYAVDGDSLRPLTEWTTTSAKETTLVFTVDPVREVKLHVFQIAAEDNDGRIDPTPASRAFSVTTKPPSSRIVSGPGSFNPTIGPSFTFGWSGSDPDGSPAGKSAPVDSFQYLLLRVGSAAYDSSALTHDRLPPFNQSDYTAMIRAAVGEGLPAAWTSPDNITRRLDDWKWTGIRAPQHRFQSVLPGEYVFALRAVDIAGATEKDLAFVRNIRHFTIWGGPTNQVLYPGLTVCSSILNHCYGAQGSQSAGEELQIFEGETVSFSWSATASSGLAIMGFTHTLDDTSSFPALDPRRTGATLLPSQLAVGIHFLYVRTVDNQNLVTTLRLPIRVVHPAFKDPGTPRSILFVDDSDFNLGNRSAPTDQVETDWWSLTSASGTGPLISLGVPYTEWDTTQHAYGTVERRVPPGLADLASYSTVVWVTDLENGGSTATGLFKTVAGNSQSELQAYLRAGGTLILTGWSLAQGTSGTANLTFKDRGPAANVGICAAYAPGTRFYNETIFPRMYMGIDNSLQNRDGLRSQGAADFTRAFPTPAGIAFGFDTASVDTGNAATGEQYPGTGGPTFKWNTLYEPSPRFPDQMLFPGLAGIEGWYMAQNFGCQPIQSVGYEDHGAPIANVIYTYHGANKGVLQDGGPSPREGLAVATLVQSHDLGTNAGVYAPSAAIGRIALFTFPLYYLKDSDAVNIMRKSFEYVNASPTLP